MWWADLPESNARPMVDTVAEDMAVFGVKDFTPPDWMAEQDEVLTVEQFDVMPENWDAVNAFIACVTQWHHDPGGTPTGLRYDGVMVVLRALGVEDERDTFRRMQVMESAALKVFHKHARERARERENEVRRRSRMH